MKKDYKKELLTLSEIYALINELKTKKDDEYTYEKAHRIIATQIALLPRSIRKDVKIKIEMLGDYYIYDYQYKDNKICDLYLNPEIDFNVSLKKYPYMTIADILKHIDRMILNPFDYKLGHTKRFVDAKNILERKKSWINEIEYMRKKINECEECIKKYYSYIVECNEKLDNLMK